MAKNDDILKAKIIVTYVKNPTQVYEASLILMKAKRKYEPKG